MSEAQRTLLETFLSGLEVELRNAREWELKVNQFREDLVSQFMRNPTINFMCETARRRVELFEEGVEKIITELGQLPGGKIPV